VLGYIHEPRSTPEDSLASNALCNIIDIPGFLRPTLRKDGTHGADTQPQKRRTQAGYIDAHFSVTLLEGLTLPHGAGMLCRQVRQTSIKGAYHAPPSGDMIPRMPIADVPSPS
jgi:hypothetical protein